jgi:hypothetical protein
MLKIETNCSVRCWKPRKATALLLIQLTSEHLRGSALLSEIQSFMNSFVVNRGTYLPWTTSLIVFDSAQQIDATSRPNWSLLHQSLTISCLVPRQPGITCTMSRCTIEGAPTVYLAGCPGALLSYRDHF